MLIFTEVFTLAELYFIQQNRPPRHCFRSNRSLWAEDLYRDHEGTVMVAPASSWVHNMVAGLIRLCDARLSTDNITVQHCDWLNLSGINPHRDSAHTWGATVYLNQQWDPSQGGLFQWTDSSGLEHSHCPQYNSMVVNNQHELHWVTPVLPLLEPRFTLQIWGR